MSSMMAELSPAEKPLRITSYQCQIPTSRPIWSVSWLISPILMKPRSRMMFALRLSSGCLVPARDASAVRSVSRSSLDRKTQMNHSSHSFTPREAPMRKMRNKLSFQSNHVKSLICLQTPSNKSWSSSCGKSCAVSFAALSISYRHVRSYTKVCTWEEHRKARSKMT